MTRPTVSVVIPAYRVTRFIGEAIDSVLAQSYTDFEVVVVNDGCPDTPALERTLESYEGRIRYVRQPNAGPSAARNRGIMESRGRLVAFLDGDDVWTRDCLRTQVERAHANPAAGVYVGGVLDLDAHTGAIRPTPGPQRRPAPTFSAILTQQCPIATSSTVVRREVFADVGMFDTTFRRAEDFDLWLRAAHAGWAFDVIDAPLLLYRVHGAGLSADVLAMFDDRLRVLRKCLATLPLSVPERELLLAERAKQEYLRSFFEGKHAFVGGQYPEALDAFRRALSQQPSARLRAITWLVARAPRLLRAAYGATQRMQR